MSLEPPAYITSLQTNIRARPISWEGAVRSGTISEGDLKKIKSIDKVRKEQRKQTIENDLDGFRDLFLGGNGSKSIFEKAAKRDDITQYLLVLSSDLIDDIRPFVEHLNKHTDPYKPFIPLLQQSSNHEDPTPLLASSVLSSLIARSLQVASRTSKQTEEAITKLISYLSKLASSSDSGVQDIAAQQFAAVIKTTKARELVWAQRKDTVAPLVDIIRSAVKGNQDNGTTIAGSSASSIRSQAIEPGLSGGVGVQLLYHVLLVLWQLTFEPNLVGEGLDEEHDIFPLYANLIRISPKEKITRVVVASLSNLLTASDSEVRSTLLPSAITARLPSILGNIKTRHLTDEDLQGDLETLRTTLDDYTKTQTTFTEYSSEVLSGHLRWSPPHKNPTFWRENARRILEENKNELPKKLSEILSKGWESDRQVLAVGCNDVGWLVKECPEKKSVLERMGLKARIMELMEAEEESVRWEALRAVGEWLRYSFEN